MQRPTGNELYDDPGLAQFYDAAHGARDDFAYCIELAKAAGSVLDLGCGTGDPGSICAAPLGHRDRPGRLLRWHDRGRSRRALSRLRHARADAIRYGVGVGRRTFVPGEARLPPRSSALAPAAS